jgi:hypothetical protein
MRTNKLATIGFLFALLLLTNCGKKPAPPVTAPAERAQPASEAPPAPPPPDTPTNDEGKTSDAPLNEAEAAKVATAYSTASGYTLMVQQFYDKNGRVPKDLNELVTAKMLLKVPTAPPGMRFVIDPNSRSVQLIRQ